jgi:single-strand DNA-binding protein
MSANINKVILAGNLTRDPEMKFTPSNMAICKIGLAVNRRYTTADGQRHEEVTFIDCDAFGKTAETIGKFLKKGRPIFIEGRLKLDQWEKEGQKFSKLKVVIDSFSFIDSGQGGGGGGGGASSNDGGYPDEGEARPQVRTRPAGKPAAAAPEISEEDIPF